MSPVGKTEPLRPRNPLSAITAPASATAEALAESMIEVAPPEDLLPENLLEQWAFLLVDSFARAGVRDVVLSPGSRSTPFVLAVAAHEMLRLHDVVDERSAAFFALGLSRAGAAPPLLLCTSGTAGAHYLPAVIEAAQSYLPLLLLTADRPFELQGCAAPQTIDQVKLFGDHARAYVELGLPDGSTSALRALRRTIFQAVHTAHHPRPGAVHLNARAKKPLEPTLSAGPAERALSARVRRIMHSPPPELYAARSVPDERGIDRLAGLCRSARAGLIVCGPAPASQIEAGEASSARAVILALAARTGFPILAEAASQMRFAGERTLPGAVVIDAHDVLLGARGFRAVAAPDLILQFGAPPTSSAWAEYLAAHPACPRWVLAPHGWNDPQSSAAGLLWGPSGDCARLLCQKLAALAALEADAILSPEIRRWQTLFSDASALAGREVAALLDGTSGLVEGEVARTVVRSLPRGGLLMLGNSLPIRDVDLYARAADADCLVLAQRGANGIDGLLSGAAGAAAASGRPTTLLVGDVSFLHDLGGLAVAARATVPLVLVVIQNGGGRIFEQLPVGRAPGIGEALAHFTTPHEIGFAHAAALFGHRYALVADRGDLARALAAAHATAGCTIVEARVPPHSARDLLESLRARFDEALARAGGAPA